MDCQERRAMREEASMGYCCERRIGTPFEEAVRRAKGTSPRRAWCFPRRWRCHGSVSQRPGQGVPPVTGVPIPANPEAGVRRQATGAEHGSLNPLSVAAYAAENDDGSIVVSMEPSILERVAHPFVQQTPQAVEDASKNGVFQRAAPESAASCRLFMSHFVTLYRDRVIGA